MELNDLKRDPSRPLNDVRVAVNREAPKSPEFVPPHLQQEQRQERKWYHWCYNKQNKTVCDRTCTSWLYIVAYSVFYIIFLSTFTLVLLYVSLLIIKHKQIYYNEPSSLLLYQGASSVGLTATPTAVNKMSLISYRDSDSSDFLKYVSALENVVRHGQPVVKKRLGPCGAAPFGYGDTPCVIVRINRHYGSSAFPLKSERFNSSDVPSTIKVMAKRASKLWLQCTGNSPYDKEHIGTVTYYPDPPGLDPGVYAPGNSSNMGLIGVQFSNFTKGMALAVECSLYYEGGKSTLDFVLYVSSSKM